MDILQVFMTFFLPGAFLLLAFSQLLMAFDDHVPTTNGGTPLLGKSKAQLQALSSCVDVIMIKSFVEISSQLAHCFRVNTYMCITHAYVHRFSYAIIFQNILKVLGENKSDIYWRSQHLLMSSLMVCCICQQFIYSVHVDIKNALHQRRTL